METGLQMKVSVIIPVYNERRFATRVIDRVEAVDIHPWQKEIIVVDDGSTDGTAEALAQRTEGTNITLLMLSENRGKAFAIRSGLAQADGDIVIIQDSDLEYDPEDFPLIISGFADQSVDAVYGSRFLLRRWPLQMKLVNLLANRFFTGVLNLIYGSRLTDEGTAYKAFRTSVIRSINLTRDRFEFCPEVTAKLLLRKSRIVEVPVSYEARNNMDGKKIRFVDGVSILKTLIACRFSRS
jgi:glycosyltransferase involved in cell wall biosynthesis